MQPKACHKQPTAWPNVMQHKHEPHVQCINILIQLHFVDSFVLCRRPTRRWEAAFEPLPSGLNWKSASAAVMALP